MELIAVEHLTSIDRAELEDGEVDPYGTDNLRLVWRDKDVYVTARSVDGRLVAAAGLVQASVAVAARAAVEIVGFGDVIVARGHRGQGFGRAVIERALQHARTMGPDFTMLFCNPRLVTLYERFGFSKIDEAVSIDQPDGPVQMPLISMWAPLRAGAVWPAGPVQLRGLPF